MTALIATLETLLIRQAQALNGGSEDDLLDVLSLSLGYYSEDPKDTMVDGKLGLLLEDFGKLGVMVVAAAGNSATTAPMFPAGFAHGPSEAGRLPLVGVGAHNPDGTVAYFSNAGSWVSCHRMGAALVSTMPVRCGGDRQMMASLDHEGHHRGTIDPDGFSGGFGVWSGTSFAAPLLAGELAAHLVGVDRSNELGIILDAGWEALRAELKWKRP